MASLHEHNPQVEMWFSNGNFTVRKTSKYFSYITIDQAQNKYYNFEKRLRVAGPEFSRLENEFERSSSLSHFTTDERQHEDSTKTQTDFFEKCQRLSAARNEFGNYYMHNNSQICTKLTLLWNFLTRRQVRYLYKLQDIW